MLTEGSVVSARVFSDGVLSVTGSGASPTSEASAIQRLEASLAKVDSSPASSPDMSRSVSATFDCLRSTLCFHIS